MAPFASPEVQKSVRRQLPLDTRVALATQQRVVRVVVRGTANHPLAQITHGDGSRDVIDRDNNWLPRPYRMRVLPPSGTTPLWNSGYLHYDGGGNVETMGDDWFLYDQAGQLKSGTVGSAAAQQEYEYDSYGNLTKVWDDAPPFTENPPGDTWRPISVDSTTNRIIGAGYDSAGDMTSWGDGGTTYTYSYYPTGELKGIDATNQARRRFFYTATGERICTWVDPGPPPEDLVNGGLFYTFRGLGGNVVREVHEPNGTYTWTRDYVWADRRLLASQSTAEGTLHYHLDQVGSLKLITNRCWGVEGTCGYLPFGELASGSDPGLTSMQFAGQERNGHLDYMHARFYNRYLGRFLSVDPVGGSSLSPQTLNGFQYVRNNPVNLVDPRGLDDEPIPTRDDDGNYLITVTASPLGPDPLSALMRRLGDELNADQGKYRNLLTEAVIHNTYTLGLSSQAAAYVGYNGEMGFYLVPSPLDFGLYGLAGGGAPSWGESSGAVASVYFTSDAASVLDGPLGEATVVLPLMGGSVLVDTKTGKAVGASLMPGGQAGFFLMVSGGNHTSIPGTFRSVASALYNWVWTRYTTPFCPLSPSVMPR